MKKTLKRFLGFMLSVLMLTTSMSAFTFGAASASGNTVYVSSGGDDANDGLTAEKPVKTLAKASSLAGAEGTVVVKDIVNVTSGEKILGCKITGLTKDSVINVTEWAMRFFGDVTIENVTLNACVAWSYILAQGHKLVIGDGVTVTANTGITTALSIRGGGDGQEIAGSCEIVIKSGAWKGIVAGTRNKDVKGNVHVTLYDTAVVSSVNMGNENAKDVTSTVHGSSTVKLIGSTNPIPGSISGSNVAANKYIDITEYEGPVPDSWRNFGAIVFSDKTKIPDDAKPVSQGGVVGTPGKIYDIGNADTPELSDVVIYLSDNGSDSQDGKTIGTAVKTLAKANSLLGSGGTLIIADTYTHKTGDKIMASKLEGFNSDCVFDVANWRCDLGANCTIDNITLNASYNWAFILCQGFALTVGENVKTTKSGAATVPLSIRGGGEASSVSGSTNIVLKGGTWGSVMGGTKNGNVAGNTNVTIYPGASVSTVSAGNDAARDIDTIAGAGIIKVVGSNYDIAKFMGSSIVKGGLILDVTEYTGSNKTSLQNTAADAGYAIYSDVNSKPEIIVPEKPKPQVPKTGTPCGIEPGEGVVYLSDLGSDANDGKTAETPVKTIAKALSVGGADPTIIVVDSFTSADAGAVGACTIVGLTSDSKFNVGAWAFRLGGDITFENITIVSATKYAYLLAFSNTLTIGERVTTVKADGITTLLGIRGGGEGSAVNKTTNVIIKSGTWGDVHGGTRNASIYADTYLTVYEGAEITSLNIGNNGSKEGNVYKANGTIKLVGNPKVSSITVKPEICEGEMVLDLTEYTGKANEKWADFATVVTDKEKLPDFVKEFYASASGEYDLSELTNYRFISDKGSDENNGLTKDKPMKSIKAAITAMGEGGTVIVTGTYTLNEYTAGLPSFNITSASKKDKFVMNLWALHTNNTHIYNLNYVVPKNHNFILHCGKPLHIGKNVNCVFENGVEYPVGIRGNENGDVPMTDITIESGAWGTVFSGTKNANLLGNAKITVSGGTVNAISAGNDSVNGRILGSTVITIKDKAEVKAVSEKAQSDGYVIVDISEFTGAVMPRIDATISTITEKGQSVTPINKTAIFINGYPDGTFLPEKVMTRAEAITVASKVAGLYNAYTSSEATMFADVKPEDWYYKNVVFMEEFADLSFFGTILDAGKGITRGEFVKLISGMIPEKDAEAPKFSDVPENHVYYNEIILAAKAGLVNGYPDGTFLPDNTLKRSEIVTILNRLTERNIVTSNTAKITKFSDIAGHWAAPHVIAASCEATTDGIILWYTGTTMSANSPVDKSTLDLSMTKEALSGVDTNDGAAVSTAVEAYAVKRRAEIANTPTAVNVTGTKYYVSSVSGKDTNDGKTPETAWQTLEKASSATLKAGDGVFFKRGEIFRGQLKTQQGVTYSAYGEGAKPAIYGSARNYANIGFWQKTNKENVWVSSDTFDKDVGLIVFDHGKAWSDKEMLGIKGFVGALTSDLKMYHDKNDNKVYLYSTSDPNTRWESIEIAPGTHGITGVGHNVTLDNLCVKYAGAHGVSYGDKTTGLTVQNCEIGWIGGMIQPGRDAEQVRFGNGVEIYVGCKDYTIKNCHIYQCYDAGITHQYFQTKNERVDMLNIKYVDNVIEYCVYNIEYVNAQPSHLGIMKDVEISGNMLLHGAEGFGIQRRDHGEAVIKGWSNVNHAENFVYYDNIIMTMEPICKLIWMGVETNADMPEMYGNVFVAKEGSPFGIYGLKTNNKVYTYDPTITNLTIGLDDNTFVYVK